MQDMVNGQRPGLTVGLIVREKNGVLAEIIISDEMVHVEEQLRVLFCKKSEASFWCVADKFMGFSG